MRFLIPLFIALALLGCARDVFVLGSEVSPPYGCTEARMRGHDC